MIFKSESIIGILEEKEKVFLLGIDNFLGKAYSKYYQHTVLQEVQFGK